VIETLDYELSYVSGIIISAMIFAFAEY